MYLESAVFENFRNIDHHPFGFKQGMNILFGGNAQGKTSVIEGIYLFAGGKSFRRAKDKEMIKNDKNFSQVSIGFSDSRRDNKMAVRTYRDMKKELFMNGVKLKKMSEFVGNFKAVLFCPEHLAIVRDEPSLRRNFVDSAISQIKPKYLSALIEYGKLTENKNALLRNPENYSPDEFENLYALYSQRIAKGSAYITSVRTEYLARLFEYVRTFLLEMTWGADTVGYDYISTAGDVSDISSLESRYIDLIFGNAEREKAAKMSLFGAHRDDFDIRLPIGTAKIFASQGQQRSIALAMKLAEGEICREETGEYPVFLFDDVLSELDRQRKNYILGNLSGKQVIVTSCDEADFSDCKAAQKIYVENGEFFYDVDNYKRR